VGPCEETADWESPEGPAPELTEAQVEARFLSLGRRRILRGY
jgi:hypothetical protein